MTQHPIAQPYRWEENVLLCDAEYVDRTAFNLTVNFERMLARPVPRGDLPRWLDCAALDGGLRPGDNRIQALFIHPAQKTEFENLQPASFKEHLDGKAFRDNLGEFTLHSFAVEQMVSRADFFVECMQTLADSADVRRLIVAGDMDSYGDRLRDICARTGGKDITLLVMQPTMGRGFQQEMLGYSLMSALGIRGDELS